MIKQAAPQHPHGLTKLQHRLLYESDSESSFDLSFSSPSSVGSGSVYSDVGSRTGSSSFSRRAGRHGSNASRSESISSVLGSSMAIQRVMMGGSDTAPSRSRQSQRQSVRAIASAFEEASKSSTVRAPPIKLPSQLGRVDEQSEPRRFVAQGHNGSTLPVCRPAGSFSAERSNTSRTVVNRSTEAPISAPATTATSQTSQAFAPRAGSNNTTLQHPHFVFPSRTPTQQQEQWSHDQDSQRQSRSFVGSKTQYDDEEPIFDIVPSPSRKRNVGLPSVMVASRTSLVQQEPDAPRASLSRSASTIASSPRLPSSLTTTSRDSLDSSYSLDSLSGHPFSLQFAGDEDDGDMRVSTTASMQDPDEVDIFSSPFINHGAKGFVIPPSPHSESKSLSRQQSEPSSAAPPDALLASSGRTLQPLLLCSSRPSSSSSASTATQTLSATSTAQAQPIASMRINQDTSFPLPPGTHGSTLRSASVERQALPSIREAAPTTAVDLGSESGADQTLAISELKQQAAALLESIRSLSDEIDESIPSTHRLPGTSYKSAAGVHGNRSNHSSSGSDVEGTKASFVAVDETYTDVWRLMDSWYWSSFEVGSQ
ncbi:hypothetical protein PHSY_001354 [Pseudozyma hubeiensis SY62]|uniref:Uncharacterized protein n=1 Tax=Pseudozyma hubeiensis (strain SY62) TaxID=1305764 RepID=R9NYK4_PSEHS|nr:hypothetical protein PHSY_001354 [Pseudozyma hubeiensis SY62]GAC93789.1 hypothetical protein PHSY_001354 [Pseudozyma hubeiensis SY62]